MIMANDLLKNYIYPVAVLSGSIIGVGFFSLPYVAMKAGIWVMLAYFLGVTALVVFLHIIFAEISLKTPDFKRFPGFARFYFGRKGEVVALAVTIIGGFGVLLAYLIVGGEFLTNIFQPVFGGGVFWYTLLYFLAASAIIFLGIKIIARVELWVLIILFLSVLFVFVQGFYKIRLSNIFNIDFQFFPILSGIHDGKAVGTIFNFQNLFLPYGALLFALWGVGLIPEVEEMLGGKKYLVKKVVAAATLIPAVFYVLFVFLVLGISGSGTTETALTGLKFFLGKSAVIAALLAGVMATFVAFVAQGFLLERTLIFDLGIKKWHAFLISCCTPFILLMLGFKSFIPLVSFLGGFMVGISGILILMMYKKIGGRNIIIYPLYLVFLAGIIYEIIYFVR